ncbi:MAG: alpha-L-fucosidase [Bacteroidetes bacterium OLB12]|nr:MAG: alpha-L-fucosidase [Bacteroidetes bacterium OLB12]HNR72832.1 alpha-L-fucosidase [Cyclobacteriaceae bacterium]
MKQLYTTFLVLIIIACSPKETPPPAPLLPIPAANQLAWHEMELNAFVHFTTNTFTGKEWGYGDESPAIFNPTDYNADQWVQIFKQAGFKGVILTCKHHDGFCLWPSKYTEHSVKNSPWRDGQGDVVRDVMRACKKYELKFGVYLSPWDRNHADYGTPAYIDYYRNQLNELFTTYGPVFEMWFDGANGGDGYYGGKREMRNIPGSTYYDWPGTLNLVRELEPEILFFSDAGPGVRWVGNERGIAGETNWNTITPDTLYAGKAGIEKLLNTGAENGTHWIPAEVDVSIRKGWFYHAEEDTLVKTPQQLFDIYLTSVGRGSTLLLNIPPDRRGRVHEKDSASLMGFRAMLDSAFKNNLAINKPVQVSAFRGKDKRYSGNNLTDNNPQTYWTTDDEITTGTLEIDLGKTQKLNFISLQEYILLGQRIKKFSVEIRANQTWQPVAEGTTIGYKRILKLNGVEADAVRITIQDAKACPVISEVSVF